MGRQIKAIYKKAESSFNNPENQKKWQGGIGILVMVVFVLSSVLFNQTVQAVNQAAGNYGYYSSSYGYNASTTSDAPPAAPTGLTCSRTANSTATCSWTAPTLTTTGTAIETGGGSVTYLVHWNTSSITACSGGSSTTSTTASASLTSLDGAYAYYVAVCARDNNSVDSSAVYLSTPIAVMSSGATGPGTAQTIGGTTPPPTTVIANAPVGDQPIITVAPSVIKDAAKLIAVLQQLGLNVQQDTKAETAAAKSTDTDAKEFKLTLSAGVKTLVTNFVAYGKSLATAKLGSGERRAVARDAFDTLGSVANDENKFATFTEEISNGKKPSVRNLKNENKQVPLALAFFSKLTGKAKPDFKNAKEDLAWNTILYRVRFTRDLTAEKAGIAKFKQVLKRNPRTPIEWAAVRAYGYVIAAK